MSLAAETSAMLADVAARMPVLDAMRAGADLYDAPNFSTLSLLNPGENALSRVLADLLDPSGKHGQGAIFLDALLGALALPALREAERAKVRVRPEFLTCENRRIDIVVNMPRLLLGIENKPWAVQGPEQLQHYAEELRARARPGQSSALLFLSDQEPATAADIVLRLRYGRPTPDHPSIQDMLTSTLSVIRAPRVRFFIEDLVRHLSQQFRSSALDTRETDAYARIAISALDDPDPARRRALAAILLGANAVRTRVVNEIGDALRTRITERFSEIAPASGGALADVLQDKHRSWSFRMPGWPSNCEIALVSHKGDGEQVYYGLKAPKAAELGPQKSGKACPDWAWQALQSLRTLVPRGSWEAHWPWYQNCATANWNTAFVARMIMEASDGRIDRHPEIDSIASHLIQLMEAADSILSTHRPTLTDDSESVLPSGSIPSVSEGRPEVESSLPITSLSD